MACTGLDFQVCLRPFGAIPVECSDENSCSEKAQTRIDGEALKPLRHRLENNSLCGCYIDLAMRLYRIDLQNNPVWLSIHDHRAMRGQKRILSFRGESEW
jgi:hypothetical protein